MGEPQSKRSYLPAKHVTRIKEDIEDAKPGTEKDDAQKIEDWVSRLLELDLDKMEDREAGRDSVETFGEGVQRQSVEQSEILKRPIRVLTKRVDEGGDVGNALIGLKLQVERLDPSGVNFEPGWLMRLIGKLPGVGSPVQRYFAKYQSTQKIIDDILNSLRRGKDELARDVITLSEDQKRMREATQRLQRVIAAAQTLDTRLEARLAKLSPSEEERRRFVAEDLLFPLRQRILDLQQQLAVNQQGVIASELIIRNNKELIRGVDRALNVTSTALNVGATVAIALESQKRVLEKIDATSKTTTDLIAGTAARLKTQGTEIHRQAAGTQLSLDSLRRAFEDLNSAMADLSTFRTQALPQMASTIREFEVLSRKGEEAIQKMEKGRR